MRQALSDMDAQERPSLRSDSTMDQLSCIVKRSYLAITKGSMKDGMLVSFVKGCCLETSLVFKIGKASCKWYLMIESFTTSGSMHERDPRSLPRRRCIGVARTWYSRSYCRVCWARLSCRPRIDRAVVQRVRTCYAVVHLEYHIIRRLCRKLIIHLPLIVMVPLLEGKIDISIAFIGGREAFS